MFMLKLFFLNYNNSTFSQAVFVFIVAKLFKCLIVMSNCTPPQKKKESINYSLEYKIIYLLPIYSQCLIYALKCFTLSVSDALTVLTSSDFTSINLCSPWKLYKMLIKNRCRHWIRIMIKVHFYGLAKNFNIEKKMVVLNVSLAKNQT